MPELRRNHYVPQFMLKHWATQGPKYLGVHCYSIRESRTTFENAKGSGAFSFASGNDLYVPEIEGERATAMEKWFSGLEDTLAVLVKQARAKTDQIRLRKAIDSTKISMALAGLECRSRYDICLMEEAITKTPALREVISNNPERGVRRLVLENIINGVTERAGRLGPIELSFLHTKRRFICSDRPFFNSPDISHRFVILTDTCMVAYAPSESQFRYQHVDATDGFVDEVNKQIAMNARDWLIASDLKQLDQYISVVQSDDWKSRRASDKVELMDIQALTSGWSIPGK